MLAFFVLLAACKTVIYLTMWTLEVLSSDKAPGCNQSDESTNTIYLNYLLLKRNSSLPTHPFFTISHPAPYLSLLLITIINTINTIITIIITITKIIITFFTITNIIITFITITVSPFCLYLTFLYLLDRQNGQSSKFTLVQFNFVHPNYAIETKDSLWEWGKPKQETNTFWEKCPHKIW